MTERLYPIGIQTFEQIRGNDYVYVDKTKYVYDLTHKYSYVFLSRPRRFGKSLLVSTLKCYFEGKKELFKGLAMENLEKEWNCYSVFHFDMQLAKRDTVEEAKMMLSLIIDGYEKEYEIEKSSDDVTARVINLLKEANKKTGKPVVLLIDEYDSPILNVMHDDTRREAFRSLLRTFYTPIKACSGIIKFGFITGITKFSQLSIFSEINNLARISMLDQWSGICGITQTELVENLGGEIEAMADAIGETKDDTIAMMKRQYDGYHFSENSEDVYNPYSLITALCNKKIANYWFETGTPHWLIEQLRRFKYNIEELNGKETSVGSFDKSTENLTSAVPLLFQSGYLTIKGYNPRTQMYTLALPNREVEIGLFDDMVNYLIPPIADDKDVFISNFGVLMQDDKVEDALRAMRSFIASIPYEHIHKNELSYHTVFFLISKLLLRFVDSEVKGSAGRSDMLIATETHIYLFEFKYNGSLNEALFQIDEKGYLIPYECDGRKLVKVAVNFNEQVRTIDGWRIDRGSEGVQEWISDEK